MAHTLPELSYSMDALAPHISKETLEFHYGKHHNSYVVNLNTLLQGTENESLSLEALIKKVQEGPIFNNAAQIWNHSFYWNCLSPQGGGEPTGALADAIKKDFGSFAEFKTKFTEASVKLFGAGWAWLVKTPDGKLQITQTINAGTPLTTSNKALLTCDVWEHAYYIDYRNLRPKYLEAFWNLVNWEFASQNFK